MSGPSTPSGEGLYSLQDESPVPAVVSRSVGNCPPGSETATGPTLREGRIPLKNPAVPTIVVFVSQPVSSPSADARLKVLLVEDSETARAIVRDLLAEEEPTLQLDEAKDLATALEALQRRSYDCALVDYVLPDGHGLA